MFLFFQILRPQRISGMSLGLDWLQGKGVRLRNARMSIPTIAIITMSLLYCTIYSVPALAGYPSHIISLFLKTTLHNRFEKPHITDAQVQGDQVTCSRPLTYYGLGRNFQSINIPSGFLSTSQINPQKNNLKIPFSIC